MSRRSLLAMLLVMPMVPALAYSLGSWAITTVDELPEYLVVGEPTRIEFTVRHHGLRPVDGLRPSVDAKGADQTVSVKDLRGVGAGRYSAQLTVPTPGEWTVVIHNGFGVPPSIHRRGPDLTRSTLIPTRAIAHGATAPAPAPPAERGARLFVAKGCVGCHVHGAVGRPTLVAVGPELTSRRYPADYLSKLLADPASVRGAATAMPNLGLRQSEIGALVAFINAPPALARR